MNPEILELWVNALESGEFKQGANRLYKPDENQWCCLGVLCELYRRAHPEDSRWTGGGFFQAPYHNNIGSSYSPPKDVLTWAGFYKSDNSWWTHPETVLTIDGETADPATHNDGRSERVDAQGIHYVSVKAKTFKQIAQAIREKYSLEVPAS
jgi:hypothetical protein